MTLDPQAKWVLDIAKEKALPTLDQLSPEAAKADYSERATTLTFKDVEIGETFDLNIPGPLGDIPIRIYHPVGMKESLPVLVYYHGGGWVVGNIDTHDALCRTIANKGPFVVVSVDYRMGPEAPFPAAVIDSVAALNWTSENIADYKGDQEQIAVGGDSAGGNLSTVVCLNALKEKSFLPKFQWLIYPATNMSMETASHKSFAEGYFLTNTLMVYFQKNYLVDFDDLSDWRASPLCADSLAGLPPALIQTAGFDPLKDEGMAYAARMNAEGSRAKHTDYGGMIHGFINLGGVLDQATIAIDEGIAELKSALEV
ncbi:alpha/beta hydrolase [Sneathiella marina]|uniref:Alpha/beta hydrolase n=1 Tax=Sneathiella marina TaxID=2950108 RepID=A0ABY4W4F6_9PROT|nr:alpha/beta hydrolase [Sneathiella marina]USG60767.1 alpha/beta hydrolase [Sneathiella marina]